MPRCGTPETSAVAHSQEPRYSFKLNDLVMERYRVCSLLGSGSFGTVVLAKNSVTDTSVAIKLLHKDEELHEDVRHEEKVYGMLLAGCDPRIDLFAEVIMSGMHQGFHTIVFDLCGGTLLDVVNGHLGLLPLPGRHILEISYQLVNAVEYLHSLGVIHTDLKLDNIAVRNKDTTTISYLNRQTGFELKHVLVTTQICVLDLGSSVVSSTSRNPGRVGTRPYRAPEVTLGLLWGPGVDVFAIGCIMAEMYIGRQLFSERNGDDREHLAALDRVLGPFPLGLKFRMLSWETCFEFCWLLIPLSVVRISEGLSTMMSGAPGLWAKALFVAHCPCRWPLGSYGPPEPEWHWAPGIVACKRHYSLMFEVGGIDYIERY
ncbi:hypothetical protein GSI_04561 [Ganoderma sinense ZZ0214-1]|uniref:Protein kinase domain-containing protein n=1 Tax=Ganoderma sinense ZZ0214-1 TaxID=1077348 RepID=A0A2G8SH74_9APHY|nr:hypothetical protein GSI_04561 [Ganoderma sinense ZZ0214-1]